jgi:hypothetical protein
VLDTKQIMAFTGDERSLATLSCDQQGPETYTVTVTGPWGEVSATAGDAFAALSDVRGRLEDRGWRLAVAGARRDVYPSGMAREAGGTRAYVLRPGQPSRETVYIFDGADERDIASVAEQEEYFRHCMESFR